ncbi:MAG: PDZ domain-containing protein [Armatimonadetes bacterium]|nr:PDZ domain-containing protein [Armatimonadota bacterium]
MRNQLAVTATAAALLALAAQTPAFAYWDDVHYHLTYYVARMVGYTPEQAYRVAAADLSADYAETTEPTQMSAMDYLAGAGEDSPEKQAPRWRFHAFRDETRFPGAIGDDPKGAEADEAIRDQQQALWDAARGERNRNLGVYLHFAQDRGQHFGFGSAFGHYFDPADPVNSTTKARQAGLALGGTVDWIDYRSPLAEGDVSTVTIEALSRFLADVSPRQQKRAYRPADIAAVVESLRAANSAPAPLASDELALYIAFIKARNGVGSAPALTAQQQAKFTRHADGPSLPAAEQVVAAALLAAGAMEEHVPGYLQARRAFTFDANGNVLPGQLDQYVITGSLKVNLAAEGAAPGPQVELVIKAPATFSSDAEYNLTKPALVPMPSSVTYEQIPIGKVQIEARLPGGEVLTSQVVDIVAQQNEVTLKLSAPGEKRVVWVLKEGYPKVGPPEALGAREFFGPRGQTEWDRLERTASPSAVTIHKRQEQGKTFVSDWVFSVTVSGVPPNAFREGDAFDLRIAGTTAGEKMEGDWHWTRHCYFTFGYSGFTVPRDAPWQRNLGVEIAPAAPTPSAEMAVRLTAPRYEDVADAEDAALNINVDQDVKLQWEWEHRLVSAQEAQGLLQGAGPPSPPTGGPGTGAVTGGGAQEPTPPAGPTSPGPSSPTAGPRLGLTARNVPGDDGQTRVVIAVVGAHSSFAGIAQPGDILVSVDGTDVVRARDVAAILAGRQVGDTVTVVLQRGDQVISVTATLLNRRAAGAAP